MPSPQEIKKIKQLAEKGDSVNQIKETLDLPKSTVYYHFKKVVGQKQKENALKVPEEDEIKGEICGIFAGDGYVYVRGDGHYEITITLNINDDYWRHLTTFFYENLGKRPQVIREKPSGRVRLRYSSKKLYQLFREYLTWAEKDKTGTIHIKKEVSQDFEIGFARGLIDTDGSKIKKERTYRYGTISKDLAKDFCEILKHLHIEYSCRKSIDKRENCRDMFRVHIYGDEAERMNKIIGPRHPKKQF